jgi:hypothetical protein
MSMKTALFPITARFGPFLRTHRGPLAVVMMGWLSAGIAGAVENGASVYPAGVETVLPGVLPGTGQTVFAEFNNFYQANATLDGDGHGMVPGFHLRVSAVAPKLVHNWGVHLLGGELVSSIATPVLYEHLDGPFGHFGKTGLGNPDVGVLDVAYVTDAWHWWYGFDVFTPAPEYTKGDVLNVGQHYYATAPEGAFSYLPRQGKTEVSSKLQYIVNMTDPATGYKSGHELVWEYDGMQNVTRRWAVGVNGYYYQQTTDDRLNGIRMEGARARAVATGPEIRYHLRRGALAFKYQKEFLVANRTSGNAFWLQFGIPLGHHE